MGGNWKKVVSWLVNPRLAKVRAELEALPPAVPTVSSTPWLMTVSGDPKATLDRVR